MSDIVSSDGLAVSVGNLVRDITDWQLISYLTVASTALIFHDWFVTSGEEIVSFRLAPREKPLCPDSILGRTIRCPCVCYFVLVSGDC